MYVTGTCGKRTLAFYCGACPGGQFGNNCSKFCNGCISRLCDHVSGSCDNKTGCNPGYKSTDNCNIVCPDGEFGVDCEKKCVCLIETCSKGTGKCPSGGCKEGFYGESCSKECESGNFGRNCGEYCGGCISNICDKLDGLCTNTTGCEPGFLYEDYCNKTCDDGYYGANCTRKCSCLNDMCHKSTGQCTVGSKSPIEGSSNGAAIGGGVGAAIIVLLVMVDRRKPVMKNKYANVNIATTIDEDDVTYPERRRRSDYQIDETMGMKTCPKKVYTERFLAHDLAGECWENSDGNTTGRKPKVLSWKDRNIYSYRCIISAWTESWLCKCYGIYRDDEERQNEYGSNIRTI
ncbi:unnamed protein product [Mytilus edulis]|uniref:Uncharacterized protein n=1 Tax=Mytilus edulis TaxID=6550 RepID=A0A8S3TKI4_MYTED|nr:unnamed protein product [Mytilus edulis]